MTKREAENKLLDVIKEIETTINCPIAEVTYTGLSGSITIKSAPPRKLCVVCSQPVVALESKGLYACDNKDCTRCYLAVMGGSLAQGGFSMEPKSAKPKYDIDEEEA
jgi:hypothetical protein